MPLSFEYQPPKVNAVEKLRAAGELGVEAAAKLLLSASQPLVPVESGDLKASGKSEPDGPMTVAVSYSATAPDGYPYGIRQHEDLALNHPNGGQAKFLEAPMHSEGTAMIEAIAEAIRAVL